MLSESERACDDAALSELPVAALCFYLLERPCLRLKSRFSDA